MKTWSHAACGALALCALYATGARAADPDTFKIGGVVSLSGTYGIFGEDMRKGVTIAIEQRGGKVLGKPIQVTWEDDETKPQPAVQKTTRLISDGSQMIFGAVSSASTLAIMNIAKQRKIPHLVTMSAETRSRCRAARATPSAPPTRWAWSSAWRWPTPRSRSSSASTA